MCLKPLCTQAVPHVILIAVVPCKQKFIQKKKKQKKKLGSFSLTVSAYKVFLK